MISAEREVRRVRHEVKQRRLTVNNVTFITPQMLRGLPRRRGACGIHEPGVR